MLGTITGDIIGSAYEKANHRAKDFTPLFHPRARFTDDTVCTVAIADALLTGTNPTAALQTWGRRYAHIGGWGQRFALWLADDDPQPYGSWGNGGAMRVSPVALLASSEAEVLDLAWRVTAVTHDHPEGIKGAQATTLAIWLARQGESAERIRQRIGERFGYDLDTTVDAIRPSYRHSEAAHESVPQALVCALEATSFEDAIRNAVSIGGDSDTIAAIAGGVAEARFDIPEDIATQAWSYLPQDIRRVMRDLYAQQVR
jgi:ADP-ribosyl-[dinitrogen reductase] hydrolase